MRKHFRTIAVSASAVTFAILLSTSVIPLASAQQSVERVEITGSSIRRTEAETALPVQVITREEIEKTGAKNVEQFLQGLGVALQGNSNSVAATASGSTTAGVSSVSLRGLGSQRTLVLIDGKRVSSGGTPTDSVTVDVNQIPASAIERVEVLKEGASAIYGSDAIAGVINFILRKDYVGSEATMHGAVTQHPGGSGYGVNGLIGLGNYAERGFNGTFIVDARKEDAIFGRQRDFANRGIFPEFLNDTSSGNTFPANFRSADPAGFGTRNIFFPNCPGPYSTVSPLFTPPGTPAGRGCRFDPAPLVSLIPETEQLSLFSNLRFRLSSVSELYGQASFAHKEQRTVIQPVPLSDQFNIPQNNPLAGQAPYFDPATGFNFSTFLLTPSSPFYPSAFLASQGLGTPNLLIRFRSAITGNRDVTDISNQFRLVGGMRGTSGRFDYDAALMHIETRVREQVNGGYPIISKIMPLLNSGQVNPFGASTPAIQAAADATQFHGDAFKTKTTIDSAQVKGTTELLKMRGGSLALAAGAEARREGFELNPSTELQQGDISGYGGNFLPVDVHRNVGALFTEISAPVTRQVELTAAARYDHYQNVGSKVSPKLAARFQPVRQVLFRTSWSKGFRAPSLTELYQPQTTGVTAPGLNDPARCDITGSPKDCVTQFPITLGGNTDLKPETSTNRTLGIVFEPFQNFSAAVDYWDVHLNNTIIFGITPAFLLTNEATFPGFIQRAPPDASCPGCPGQIVNIQQTNLNLGETNVSGIDVDFKWRLPAGQRGAFTLGFNGTYINKYEVQNPDRTFTSVNGQVSFITNGNGGVVPRWRHFATIDWRLNPWTLTLVQQYQRGYADVPGTFDDPSNTPPIVHTHVGDYVLYHLYTSYQIKNNLRLTFGIRNLFDRRPPYTNAGGQNYFQSGYDPGYADPRLRTFLLSATYKFN